MNLKNVLKTMLAQVVHKISINLLDVKFVRLALTTKTEIHVNLVMKAKYAQAWI